MRWRRSQQARGAANVQKFRPVVSYCAHGDRRFDFLRCRGENFPRSVPADQPQARTDANSATAHQQLLEKAKQGGIDVYFIGDSIVRCWGASDAQYKDLLANWKENFFGWNAADFAWGATKFKTSCGGCTTANWTA